MLFWNLFPEGNINFHYQKLQIVANKVLLPENLRSLFYINGFDYC